MRGYQKKVIYMKNTGSQIFEEAYFIVKSDSGVGVNDSRDMVVEANRIIKENFTSEKSGFLMLLKKNALSFIVGAALSFLLCLLVYFLTRGS